MSVKQWLESLSLVHYHEQLMNNGFDTLAKCSHITEADLDRVGVSMPGHRKRILSHLQTALDFSDMKTNLTDQGTGRRTKQISTDNSSHAVNDLIDLRSLDCMHVNDGDAAIFPIELPPKTRTKDIDVLLGLSKPDADLDDKKRPVPAPRKSVNMNPLPTPRPRGKKPKVQKIGDVSDANSSTDIQCVDDCTNQREEEKSSVEIQLESKEKAEQAASFDANTRTSNIIYADLMFDTAAPSSFAADSGSEVKRATEVDLHVNLADGLQHVLRTERESVCSLKSPDDSSNASLPVSVSYEGDVEDLGEGFDFVNPLSKKAYSSETITADAEFSRQNTPTAEWYTGVWNLTSGQVAGHYRPEIKSDDSSDEHDEIKTDRLEHDTFRTAPPLIPSLSCPDITVTSRPAMPLPSRPPLVPVRKLEGKLSDGSSVESGSSNLSENVTSSSPDVAFYQNPPVTSASKNNAPVTSGSLVDLKEKLSQLSFPPKPPPVPVRRLETKLSEGASAESSDSNLFTTNVNNSSPDVVFFEQQPMTSTLKHGVSPTIGSLVDQKEKYSKVSLLPVRNAPPPPTSSTRDDKVVQPSYRTPPPRIAPPPPLPSPFGGGNQVQQLSSIQQPFPQKVSLDTAVPLRPAVLSPPIRNPPQPPPKVGIPDYSSSCATYAFVKDVEDDEVNDETETPGEASFTESDDTLSDGGEFFDIGFRRPALDVLHQSIPIISSTTTRQKSRKGFLHKLTSKPKRLTKLGPPWQKRWVAFDGGELRYFSSNKSFVSKRIIPVCTMVTVETDIRNGELHPFCFKLTTIDRVYTFATDDVDDMSLWASVIMQAIIQHKSERESFVEGGDMSPPDLQGYVRMEGSKSKRFLVVKKATFCFYNTHNDFKSYTPIHRVEMQLASVKDVGRFKLQIHTPHVAFMLLFENQDELGQWKDAFEDSIAQGLGDDCVIKEIYTNPSNQNCADCDMRDPEWASINLGITLCKFCAGIHRSLSWSKVRSLRMDSKVWKPSVRQLLITIGNDNSNKFWEWTIESGAHIDHRADITKRKEFILHKYQDKMFCRFHPLRGNPSDLNEALCKQVLYGNVLETLQLIFSGADVLCKKNNETPIQLAKKSKQVLQEEFLYQNGGDPDAAQPVTTEVASRSSGLCHRGYLLKTGSNVKGEFLRRWCILENGVFSYFDNDKSTVANDSIEKKEMMSVGLAVDERYDHTFDVGTTKQSGRVFLFASESNDDRMQWITKLAKVMANVSPQDVEKITELDRGGNVFARWGSTREWESTWAQMSHKTLKIFNQKEHVFKEVDLRKAKSISYRQASERCVESYDDGPAFVIDLQNGQCLYVQGDLGSETERWFTSIQKAMMEADKSLGNQSLTANNVPVIVEKCINFIVLYGLDVEGIYRLNGQHSKVTRLLELFIADACSIVLKPEEFQVHDVANAFKRFFRTLDDPLLTYNCYKKWIDAARLPDQNAKLQWYKYLLKELPQINYCTLKQVITHLARVAESENVNKMSVTNLASIFGPVLMQLDQGTNTGYGSTNFEICVVKDFMENHVWLFEVKEEELEQEKKIKEARKKIEMLNIQQAENKPAQMQDVIIGVYINNKDGDTISLKVSMQMRVQELLNYVIEKARLKVANGWALFEVICNGELERPLHYMEGVLDVTMKWSSWPIEFCRDNYICLKRNSVYDKIIRLDDAHPSMFFDLKYASKKSFHKYCFEFSRYCLSYRTSAKATNPTASWNVEDLTIYIGCQRQRNPPSKFCFSFICTHEQLVSPFFGHCISCSSDDELYRWLSVLLRAQHPEGLLPSMASGLARSADSSSDLTHSRFQSANADSETASSEASKSRWLKTNLLQKLNLK